MSLGAVYAAGLVVGFWPDTEALRANWHSWTCSAVLVDLV